MQNHLGQYVRKKRLALREENKEFSLRKVAGRVGIQPSYLSKIERGENAPLSEEKIVLLAMDLSEDRDLLLALGGKIASDVTDTIKKRPQLFTQLIRELKELPDQAVLRVIKEVRDGTW